MTVNSKYSLWAYSSIYTSHLARSHWMISVPTFSCRGTPPMESLIRYPFDIDCFTRFRSFGAILPELSCGVWPIRAFSPFSDLLDFWFIFFFCSSSSCTTPGPRLWVHSYWRRASWTWANSRKRTWWWCSRWFREWLRPVWWLTWTVHTELSTRIVLFCCNYRVIIFLLACMGGWDFLYIFFCDVFVWVSFVGPTVDMEPITYYVWLCYFAIDYVKLF